MNKIKTKNRRAFTLMELLIVVIVIGVLAAVTLPKFNRVIENRKVTEAEEMMSAVRTEQERRCSLDKNYTTNFDNLKDIIASNNTKNYTYSLQPQGISAQSNSSGYTLKILSYEDGSYCCEGDGCKKLNKNYPDCSTLSFPESVCIGEESDGGSLGEDPGSRECADGEVQGSQTCNICGTQTTQLCVNGKWTDSLGSCSKTEEECKPKPECEEGEHRNYEICNKCGSRYLETCIDGKWQDVPTECTISSSDECTTCSDLCKASSIGSVCKHPDLEPPAGRKSMWKLWYPDRITSDVTDCIRCDMIETGKSYYDEEGNFLGTEYDFETCSVGECPEGTVELSRIGRKVVCGASRIYKPQKSQVTALFNLTGYIGEPGVKDVMYFIGGQLQSQGCGLCFSGGRQLTTDHGGMTYHDRCEDFGGPEAYCNKKCSPAEDDCDANCVEISKGEESNLAIARKNIKIKSCSFGECMSNWCNGFNPNFASSKNKCAQGVVVYDYATIYECVRSN